MLEWRDVAKELYEMANDIVARTVATRLNHALVDPYLEMEKDKFVVSVQQFLSCLINDYNVNIGDIE